MTSGNFISAVRDLRLVFDLPPRLIGLDHDIARAGALGWLIGSTNFGGKGEDAC